MRGSIASDISQIERQLMAEQITNARLTERLQQVEYLSTQVASLKNLFEKQQQAVAQSPTSEDIERRLSVLENAKPAAETHEFARLRIDIDKLQSATAPASKHKTVNDPLRAVKDGIDSMLKTALQPVSRRLDEFQTTLNDLSAKVAESKKFCEDLHQHDMPTQLRRLGDEIQRVGSDEVKTHNKTIILDEGITTLRQSLDARVLSLHAAVKKVEDDQTSMKTITDQVESFQSELSQLAAKYSILSSFQKSLTNGHSKSLDNDKELPFQQEPWTSQPKASQTDQSKLFEKNHFTERFKDLESRVKKSEELASQVQQLVDEQARAGNRVTKLELTTCSSVGLDRDNGANDVDDASSSPEIKSLKERFRVVEDRIGEITSLHQGFNNLEADVEAIDKGLHGVNTQVEAVSESVKSLFAEQFDPLKAHTEEQIKQLSQRLVQLSRSLNEIQDKAKKAEKECPASNFSAPQLKLVQDMVQDSAKATELKRLQEALGDLQKQVTHGLFNGKQANDTVKAAVRNLQDQYDNISTDDLYQKIARWIIQQYPTSMPNLIHRVETLEHEAAQVRVFTGLITRTPNGAQTLTTLIHIVPEIVALVQSSQSFAEFSGVLSKVVVEVETLKQSSTEAHTRNL
ncbi:hypothetical protein SVAN01_03894 [Stagonosporopsis vannaccii]|nr:hypothetical protein SVAN01_03894 [Stagonosporopsis vannaccii]